MEEKERLKKSIINWRKKRESAQKMWSFGHHVSLFGSIVCSILAGAQIQLSNNPNVASVLTAIAAALTGMAASGGFERKWRSNRLSRSKADCLLIDLDFENVDLEEIKKTYKLAIEKHDLEIIGDTKEENP